MSGNLVPRLTLQLSQARNVCGLSSLVELRHCEVGLIGKSAEMQIFVQLPARARTLTLAVNECDQVWEVKQRFFQAFNLEAHQQNEPKLVCGYRVLEDHKMLHESDVKDCSTLHLHLPLHGGMPKKVVKKKKEKTEGASSASAAAPPEEEEEFPVCMLPYDGGRIAFVYLNVNQLNYYCHRTWTSARKDGSTCR